MSLLEGLPEAVLSYLCTEFLPERDHESVTRTSKEIRRGTVVAFNERRQYSMLRCKLLVPIKSTLEWALQKHIQVLTMEYPVSTAAVDDMARDICRRILERDSFQEERLKQLATSKSWTGYTARTLKILEPNDEIRLAKMPVLPTQRCWRQEVAWARRHLKLLG